MNSAATQRTNGLAFLRRSQRLQVFVYTLLMPGMSMFSSPVMANPQGAAVVRGDVQIQSGTGGNLQILQNSQNAIINWDSFSINAGELTQFRQPNSQAAVLNRVTGGDPSAIHGALRANGNVFVINPNGILVGPGGTIDVHGLVLSTLDVSNGEFLAGGDMKFSGAGEGVTNMGRINAIGGDVFLIGKTVTNTGAITASGTVGLAAGQEVLLTAGESSTGERMFVRATGAGASGTGVLNDGTIDGAAVELKAHGNVYALAINNKGSIRATGAETSGGRVFLRGVGGSVENSGSIQATSSGSGNAGRALIEAAYAKVDGLIRAEGGNVEVAATQKVEVDGKIDVSTALGRGGDVVVEGKEIALGADSIVDASGSTGGGAVRIGGGFRGADSTIANAQQVDVASGATIRANTVDSGDAGSVVIWSDGDTNFHGTIEATAVGEGRGGMVEVSGKENLLYRGTVSTLSESGQNGTLLLDPTNFEIISGGPGAGGLNQISNTDLQTQLASGNVVIATDSAGSDPGTITVASNATVNWTTNNSLALLAHGDIVFNASVSTTGTGNITAIAGWNGGGYSGTAGVTQPASIVFQGFVNDSTWYGNASGGATGSVFIGDGAQTAGVFVGSMGGQTNVAANAVTLAGGAASDAYAQIGYRGAGTGAINVYTKEGGLDLKGGVGSSSYAQIGHGGGTLGVGSTLRGVITLNVGGDLLLRGGALGYAMVGHGGNSGSIGVSGDNIQINMLGGGDVDLLAGTGSGAYAQIGHGGLATTGTLSGAITIDDAHNVTLKGGGDQAYAQIGHGGASNSLPASGPAFPVASERALSTSGEIRVVNTTGAIAMTGGDGVNNAYTQIGHGGVAIAAGGTLGGDITVEAGTGGVTMQGGLGSTAYAMIGNGGYQIKETVLGTVRVEAKGSTASDGISLLGGNGSQSYADPRDGFSGAFIGNSGLSGNGAINGDTYVTIANGGLTMRGGQSYYAVAAVGHVASGSTAARTGLIDIQIAGGDLFMEAGKTNYFAFSMIGHGGWDSGNRAGQIDVTVSEGNITLLSGTGSTFNFAKIGHGGYGNSSTQIDTGAINVSASGLIKLQSRSAGSAYTQIGHGGYGAGGFMKGEFRDAIMVSAGAGVTLLGGTTTNEFSMIGHGGVNVKGIFSGDIKVTTGTGGLTMDGGSAASAFTQVGHGGYQEANAKGTYSISGKVSVDAGTSPVSVTGGGGSRAYSQIGHGGSNGAGVDGTYTITAAPITVDAGSVSLTGSGSSGAAQIGHGGVNVNGSSGAGSATDSEIKVTTVGTGANGGVTLKGGASDTAYAMIGSGGRASSFNASGNITVTSAGGGVSLTGVGTNAFALIGNGGHEVAGALSGKTTVTSNGGGATDGVYLKGGAAAYSYANIGHATNNVTGSIVNSDTEVTIAGGGLRLAGGTGTLAVAAIGLQSRAFKGVRSGSIDVTVTSGDVEIDGGDGTASPAQIGHGGWGISGTGDLSGKIDLKVENGSLTMTGGGPSTASDYGKMAIIGHGGGDVHTGSMTGSVTVDVDGDITMNSGSGGDSITQIGHGGSSRNGTKGTATDVIKVISQNGAITMSGGSGANAFSLIGLGGRNMTGDMLGSVEVTSKTGGVLMQNGDGTNAFAMIGMGGFIATGNKDGRVTVSTVSGVTMDARVGGGSQAFIQIGLGGYSSSGAIMEGPISVTGSGANSAIQLLSGVKANNYTQIGIGGTSSASTTRRGGLITVEAGSGGITLQGGGLNVTGGTSPNTAYAQIGHGGSNSSGITTGDISVTTKNGGDVIVHGGGRQYSHGQIGHGGRSSSDSPLSGKISVISDGRIELKGATDYLTGETSTLSNETFAQIGHGGMFSSTTFDGAIELKAQTGVLLESGSSYYARAQVGHGGYSAGTNAGVGVEMVNSSITVTTVSGGIILDGSKSTAPFGGAQIGHGGTSAYNAVRKGAFRGDITVDGGTGNVELHSGSGSGTFAMIGNGGTGLAGDHSGAIHVSAQGDLIMDLRTSALNNTFARIGHGGDNTGTGGAALASGSMLGNLDGMICVYVGGSAILNASGGTKTNNLVQIGHGGTDFIGNFSGDISLVAQGANGITLKGGSGTGAYSQVGHGGLNTAGTMTGNVYVVAEHGDITLTGGSGVSAYAMLGHGDGAKTSTGQRGGGMHIFAAGDLTGTGGSGAANQGNVYIFHQNSNGLQPADYLGGDGYQKVVNGTTSLPSYVTVDESTMFVGNIGQGPIQILDSSATDYTLDIADISVNNSDDFYILTGGNIAILSSYQNAGDGNVTLVAGWDGMSGGTGAGSVSYEDDGNGGFNYCKPIIVGGPVTGIDFNDCETFGNNGKTITIGSASQTSSVHVGTAGGTNTFAAAGITMFASDTMAAASTQLGFYSDGTAASGAINVRVKDLGIEMNAGKVSDAYVQIGHGGTAAIVTGGVNAPINISFCESGDIDLLSGAGAGAYAQIGHGGNGWHGVKKGAITIAGANNITLKAGPTNAYAQIGHGGEQGLTSDGATEYGKGEASGAIQIINTAGKVGLYAGTGTNATAQIGHGGVAMRGPMSGDITVEAGTGGIELLGNSSTRTYALIGNGGYNVDVGVDNTVSGNVTVRAKGTAATDGIVMQGGSGSYSGAFIGNGIYENTALISGSTDVSVRNGGLSMTGGSGSDQSKVVIGHANTTDNNTMTGYVKVDIQEGDLKMRGGTGLNSSATIGHDKVSGTVTRDGDVTVEVKKGGIFLEGGMGQYAPATIGHAGRGSSGTAIGNIYVKTYDGRISLHGSDNTISSGFSEARIGHGGWESGTKTGTITVISTGGDISVEAGNGNTASSTYNFAQIGHGGYGNGTTSNVINQKITVNALDGNLLVKAGTGTSNFAIVGHGGLGLNSFYLGSFSGDIEVKVGGAVTLEGGNRGNTHAQIGNGGGGIKAPVSGKIDVTAGLGGISLKSGSGANSFTQIGNGGFTSNSSAGGDVTVKTEGAISLQGGGTGSYTHAMIGNGGSTIQGALSGAVQVEAKTGGIQLQGGNGVYAYALIGNGGYNIDSNISGTTTVKAQGTNVLTDGIRLKGGEADQAVAHIGHLNSYTGSQTATPVSATDKVEVSATAGDIVLQAGDTGYFAHAQIGHGGRDSDTDKSGSITVTANNGNIILRAGGNRSTDHYAHAMIGHGGYANGVGERSYDADIKVESKTGSITLTGGDAAYDYAQIGHGGTYAGTGGMSAILSGKVEVVAAGDIVLQGGTASTTYTQIGHGGRRISGSALTSVGGVVDASKIYVKAGGDISLLGGSVGYSGSKIGHGNQDQPLTSFVENRIDVDAGGNLVLRSYQFATHTGLSQSGTQIGHGGYQSSVIAADGSVSGYSGDIKVDVGGKLDLIAAKNATSYNWAFIGHTAYFNVKGNHSGDITVTTGKVAGLSDYGINIVAGSRDDATTAVSSYYSFAGIGHHGHSNGAGGGDLEGDITVIAERGGLTIRGADMGANTADMRLHPAQIGHGDYVSNGVKKGNIKVTIADDILLESGNSRHSPVQIGHGGVSVSGNDTGWIDVTSQNGSIILDARKAGTADGNNTRIGHGGITNKGIMDGYIMVSSAGNIQLYGGNANGTNAQIGHGGASIAATTSLLGDITLTIGANLGLYGGGTNGYAMVGHGGNAGNIGITTGTIQIRLPGDVELISGSGGTAFTQIGHGGGGTTGTLTGDVKIDGAHDVTLKGGGAQAYAQIGHGGASNTLGIKVPAAATDPDYTTRRVVSTDGNIDIINTTGAISMTGGTGVENSYVQIGHGGIAITTTGITRGNITVEAGMGGVLLQGGLGSTAYSLIGNGGYQVLNPISGTVRVDAKGTGIGDGISLLGGDGNHTYGSTTQGRSGFSGAMIGNSGYRNTSTVDGDTYVTVKNGGLRMLAGLGYYSNTTIGHSGLGTVGVRTGLIDIRVTAGDMTMEGGDKNYFAYSQVGHGGWDSGNRDGKINVVVSDGNISLLGGANSGSAYSYAMIGHGGYGNAATEINTGEITVSASGAISEQGGDGLYTFAMIGHGGLGKNSFMRGEFHDTITVTAGSGISLTGGTRDDTFAMIGHGGANVFGIITGNVNVTTGTGGLNMTGGIGAYSNAQVGHGGRNEAGINGSRTISNAKITVNSDFINLTGGGTYSYAEIGHGGYNSVGSYEGDIEVEATTGSITFGSNNTGAYSYSQIGHGGVYSLDGANVTFSGMVKVNAAEDIILRGGNVDTSYAQIGHGGRRLGGTATQAIGGAVNASAISVTAGRDVQLLGGTKGYSVAKIGHGNNATLMSSFVENKIDVEAGRNVVLQAAQFNTYTAMSNSGTQIGHGGTEAPVAGGASGYSGDITVEVGGKLDLIAAKNATTFNYAFIGHTAYYNVKGNHSGDIVVKTGLVAGLTNYGLNITGADRDDAVSTSGSYYSFAGIGHHGHSNGAGGGNLDGDITVIVERGDLTMTGATNASSSVEVRLHAVQIGHGDYNSDGLKTGDIKVCVEGDIVMENGTSKQSPVQIGHGGFSHDGNIIGKIEVSSTDGGVTLDASQNGAADVVNVQIGHGGYSNTGTFDGDIYVTALDDILLKGGSATAANAQIGHGGVSTNANLLGGIYLVTGGNLDVVGGTNANGYAMVGHGTTAPQTSGIRQGEMKLLVGGTTKFTDNLSGVRLGHGTSTANAITNSGITLVTDKLNLTNSARKVGDIVSEMGQDGEVTFAVLSGDLVVEGAAARFQHGYAANFVASGDVVMLSSVQNNGSGAVNVAGGWSSLVGYNPAMYYFDGSNGLTAILDASNCLTLKTLEFDFSPIAADESLWGNNGGSVYIGNGDQAAGVVVGSSKGDTTVLGHAVEVLGGDTPASYAVIGSIPSAGVNPTGSIVVTAKTGGMAVHGGSAINSYAQIGHRVMGSIATSASGDIAVTSAAGLSLLAGNGLSASAQIGHGGSAANADLSGDIEVKVADDIVAIAGPLGAAYVQVGHGGFATNGDMKGEVLVEAGASIELSSPAPDAAAYAKIGHGDDLYGMYAGFSGTGERDGAVTISAGTDITLTEALLGHVNSTSRADLGADAPLWVAASQLDPTDPSVGTLTTDSGTEFSGTEVRFYLPRRENNQIGTGALINGEAYNEGGLGDPWPEQRDNEFTMHIVTEDGTILDPLEHGNTLGSGPTPIVASNFSFYYDTIVMGDRPIVIPPIEPPVEPPLPPQDPNYLSMYPDDRAYDEWTRRQEEEYKRPGSANIYYEGFSQYGRHGESIYTFNESPDTIR